MNNKLCLNCKIILQYLRKDAKYCSPSCRNKFWYKSHAQGVENNIKAVDKNNLEEN